MANKSLKINPKEFDAILGKISSLSSFSEKFNEEVEQTSKDIVTAARDKFEKRSRPELERRGEDTAGLSSSIKRRVLKRKRRASGYKIEAGGVGRELMAYVEFGTRSRRIDLSGIRSIFGAKGDAYALRFKGSDNPRTFTHLRARPYFFNSVREQQLNLIKRVDKHVKRILKK